MDGNSVTSLFKLEKKVSYSVMNVFCHYKYRQSKVNTTLAFKHVVSLCNR